MATAVASKGQEDTANIGKIIFSAAAGTMIEWYDFYIYGSLGSIIAPLFYRADTPLGAVIVFLATFAVGFIVRPFGALVFGRVGDLIGRKYTFLVTMTLMGICTFIVGILPTYETIGALAGIILIVLRILQGLALGGEYGGAATYIAEHAPHGKRGYYTSFIQITATAGLFMSLGVILITRQIVGEDAFKEWGWRIPFLVSILLVGVSLYIRSSLAESPLFNRLKSKGAVSKNPIVESFGNPYNRRWVILALFGATMGQGVVWYTGQFFALYYLQTIFKVPLVDSNLIVGVAILLATPLFIVTGSLSDRIGRKPIMLAGMLLGVLTYLPIYTAMDKFSYFVRDAAGVLTETANPNYSPVMLGLLIFIQMIYVTMVYGPIAAFLVELFPTKIRYTSMSLPYHIGNGVFGGLVPLIGLKMIQSTGNHLSGLYYPIAVAAVCFIVGLLFVKETNQVDIAHESNQ